MLNWLLWVKWLVLAAFSVCVLFASKFVTVLEIDAIYSLVLIGMFSPFLLFVPYYSMVRKFSESQENDLRSVCSIT